MKNMLKFLLLLFVQHNGLFSRSEPVPGFLCVAMILRSQYHPGIFTHLGKNSF